jgi:hypothetical protein
VRKSVTNIQAEVRDAGAKLVPHKQSTLTTLYGWLAGFFGVKDFTNTFWLTLRPTIYHPNHILNPFLPVYEDIIRHELVHVRQQRRAGLWGWVIRYLASQQFRWEQEREAYLVNVRAGDSPVLIAATLRRAYRISNPTEQAMALWLETHR